MQKKADLESRQYDQAEGEKNQVRLNLLPIAVVSWGALFEYTGPKPHAFSRSGGGWTQLARQSQAARVPGGWWRMWE